MDAVRLLKMLDLAVSNLFNLLYIILFVRVALTWVPNGRDSAFFKVVDSIIGPLLYPIQKMVRKSPISRTTMMIDFSPVVLGMVMSVVQALIQTMLMAVQL